MATRIRLNSNFGNLGRDGSRFPIQTTNGFQTADATGTPVKSPFAYTTSTTTLTVPANAVSFVVQPSTTLLVSELANLSQYYTVAANSVETFPCASLSNIYIQGSGAGTAQFRFAII